jgi:pilus assembly protein FimV
MALQREQIVQSAEKLVARGKIEPAIKEYRKLLAENPNDINTLNRVGDLYARIQRIDEAVDFFTQIAEQYTAEGFFVKAIAIYKKIIKLDPTRLEVYEQLAELYHKQGLVTEARTQYQVLADYYQKHANAASAIAIYQKMAQLEPDNPTYHVKLAEIYHQQQLVEKAMAEYRIIAELMIKHGRPQEAAQVYERALDIDTQNIPFITDAVLKLREAGNAAGAAHFLAVAVERNPQAERIARMVGSGQAVETVETIEEGEEIEVEPELAAEPAPPRKPGRSAPQRPIEIEEEEEAGFSMDDDLARAMAEAAAAVGGGEVEATVEPEEDESGEIELSLDDMFEIDLPDEDGEPTSLVKPPADLLEAPRRPAWAQEAPAEPEELDLELDLDALGGPFALQEPSPPEPATESQPAMEFELEHDDELSGWQTLPPEPTLERPPATGAKSVEESFADHAGDAAAEDLRSRAGFGMEREPEREEDLVTEAEVLAKYGLQDKAIERLEEALRVRPDHLGAYALLIQLHLDKDHHAQVAELAGRMAAAAAGREPWLRVRKRLVDAGYTFDGDRATGLPGGVPAAPAAVPAPGFAAPPAPLAPVAEPEPILEELPELELPEPELPEPLPVPVAPIPPIPPIPPTPPPRLVPTAAQRSAKADRVDDLLRGLMGTQKKTPPRPAAPAPAAPVPSTPAPIAAPPAPPPPAPAPPKTAPPANAVFNPLQIGELVESLDLSDEDGFGAQAPPVYDSYVEPFPGEHPPVRLTDLPPAPPAYPPAGVNVAALDDTGASWLDEPPPPEETSASELFGEEDDFFDLAGELVEELSREEVFQRDGMLVQSEQTLEEIVEGFKKGVAEHLSPTDYDTHFNLGIAYREMGLLDEGIGEFQLAAKDPRYLVLCCSMLGLCFLDKGMPELAVKWYQRALEFPGIGEEDSLGMRYDLGNTYMALGDWETAYQTFVDLYGMNADYRDVQAKLEELGHPR